MLQPSNPRRLMSLLHCLQQLTSNIFSLGLPAPAAISRKRKLPMPKQKLKKVASADRLKSFSGHFLTALANGDLHCGCCNVTIDSYKKSSIKKRITSKGHMAKRTFAMEGNRFLFIVASNFYISYSGCRIKPICCRTGEPEDIQIPSTAIGG